MKLLEKIATVVVKCVLPAGEIGQVAHAFPCDMLIRSFVC